MPKVSIIMTAYDQLQSARHVTMAALANITMYTNPALYEMIVVDNCPKYEIRDDYNCLKIDKLIKFTDDIGYYPSMNVGAEEASGEYLCFIENDVFVWKDWLENLLYYVENGKADCVLPDQIPHSYAKQMEFEKLSFNEAINKGASEQALLLISREAFDKVGGWDPKLEKAYGWKRFYLQMNEAGVSYINTAKVQITHIAGMTYYNTLETDPKKHAAISKAEGEYLNAT